MTEGAAEIAASCEHGAGNVLGVVKKCQLGKSFDQHPMAPLSMVGGVPYYCIMNGKKSQSVHATFL
jgi:hypothetical protein